MITKPNNTCVLIRSYLGLCGIVFESVIGEKSVLPVQGS